MKTLSVALIVKNEENTLPRLLKTVNFADEIIIVDTGSTDATVESAKRFTDKIFFFEWCDDFSAARNYALSKAKCDYVMWLDADDVITENNAEKIKLWKVSSESADTFMAKYCTAFDEKGEVTFWYYRERLMRNCELCRFTGAVHEAVTPFGQIVYTDIEVMHKQEKSHGDRNLKIYEKLISSGKILDARSKYYYARELLYNGDVKKAEKLLEEFADSPEGWYVNKIEALTILAKRCFAVKNYASAIEKLLKTFALSLPRAEICCLLGDCFVAMNLYDRAEYWYERALCCRETDGFLTRDHFDYIPYMQLCVCCWKLGKVREAFNWHKKAKEIKPESSAVSTNEKFFASINMTE